MGRAARASLYRFEELTPGEYLVCETLQRGWIQLLPNRGVENPSGDGTFCRKVEIVSGAQMRGRSFLNYKLAIVSGFKFGDLDYN